MTLVDIYADEGITEICLAKRDDFNRMIRDSKEGKEDRPISMWKAFPALQGTL